jgi:AraC-like DNA-binding protein
MVSWLFNGIVLKMFNELNIRLLFASWTTIADRWNNYDLYNGYWRLYVNKSDGAWLTLADGSNFKLRAGTIYFIPAWTRIVSHTRRAVDHFYIHFDIIGLTMTTIHTLFPLPILIRSGVDFDDLISDIGVQYDGPTNDAESLCRMKSLLYDSFAALIHQLPDTSRMVFDQTLAVRNRFGDCLRYIDDHLSDDLSNPLLALRCHMSVNHFVHTFKFAIGQSPAHYVLHRRIAGCARKLVFTSDTVDSIAESAGFANRFHFSRHFKKIMGVSPVAYRKNTHA